MPARILPRLAIGAAVALCIALSWPHVAEEQGRFTVKWAGDRLSVHAPDAPLADVMSEVARQTGLNIVGADKFQGTVAADFTDLTIAEALKTLLVDVNYFVQQEAAADKGRVGLVVRVHSMARVSSSGAAADTVLRVPAIDTLIQAETDELEEEKQEAEDDPDVAEERKAYLDTARQLVASGVFSSTATVAQLEDYLDNDNPELRLEAVKALADRPIADSLPSLIDALTDDSIEVRRVAINALGRATDRESLQHIGLLLEKDDDISVRYAALRVLALRADASAAVHLQKVVDDQDITIRDAARQMLAEFERIARAKKEKKPPVE
jgi:HEAT repeat protein